MHVWIGVWTLCICQISSQSADKWLWYRPKASKMPISKIFKLLLWPKYATQKDKNGTIRFAVNFCIEISFFFQRITTLKFSPLFTRISQIFMSWPLTWPWLDLAIPRGDREAPVHLPSAGCSKRTATGLTPTALRNVRTTLVQAFALARGARHEIAYVCVFICVYVALSSLIVFYR